MAVVTQTTAALRLVAGEAAESAQELSSKSYIIDTNRYQSLLRISQEELVLGGLLARGTFNDVYEVEEIKVHIEENETEAETDSRSSDILHSTPSEDRKVTFDFKILPEQAVSRQQGESRFVVKFLSQDTVSDLSAFRTGFADLILEAKFLATFDHPNIISLRGVADGEAAGNTSSFGGGYFLLLDRLHCTLDQRILKWRKQRRKARNLFRKQCKKDDISLATRLHIALEISKALSYLHSLNIIYRDLKPENVGFDYEGKLKLFDFGLAKELHPSDRMMDDLYRMTGSTGSLRYMAPEVGRNMPYGLSADVYSFSILLWELCSLKQPFKNMSRESHCDNVLYGQFRPDTDIDCPCSIKQLITDGWSEDIQQRPQTKIFSNTLSKSFAECRHDC